MLRLVLSEISGRNFTVGELSVEQRDQLQRTHSVSVWLSVQGSGSVTDLTAALIGIAGVLEVSSDEPAPPAP